MSKKLAFTYLLLLFAILGQAQEELGNLWTRSSQLQNHEATNFSEGIEEVIARDNFVYRLDTLEMPLRDDFATYHVKQFINDTIHPRVTDTILADFYVDKQIVDTFSFKRDTVYNLIFNPITKKMDSVVAPVHLLEFYTDTTSPLILTGRFKVFPSYYTVTQNGLTRKVELTADSILLNKRKTYYFVDDDNFSYWVAEGTHWNSTMAVLPPTIGQMTFDGLDKFGKPYDNSSKLTYGLADVFTSKPINLYANKSTGIRFTANDSIFLSFFVQGGGNGDIPEEEDSLVLEFYSPTDNKWDVVWSRAGDTIREFKQEFVHVYDSSYLQRGFKFRFKNYATLSGNFDHWHLDYVQLDHSRQKNEEIKDVAFVTPIHSFLKNYTSVPWKHYKEDPNKYMAFDSKWLIRNLGSTPSTNESFYHVHKREEVNPFYKSTRFFKSSIPTNDTFSVIHSINSQKNYFKFPTDTHQRQYFTIMAKDSSTEGNQMNNNNQIYHTQIFDRYYSYDDGSAEKTYQLNLVGTSVAVEFETPVEDTLRSVLINFVETYEPPASQRVNILVYTDLNASPVYQSGPVQVIYSPAGRFYRYSVPPIAVNGKFYVGYQQLERHKTYVGYDVNFNNQDRTYISQIGDTWYNSSFKGTVMIRADFGFGNEKPLSTPIVEQTKSKISFYPNPATSSIQFKNGTPKEVKIYNITGKLVLQSTVNNNQLNISKLNTGFYLISIDNQEAQKLLITH